MKKFLIIISSLIGIVLFISSIAAILDIFLSHSYRQNKGYVDCGYGSDDE